MTENKTGSLVEILKSSVGEIRRERANNIVTNIHRAFKEKIDSAYNKLEEIKVTKAEKLTKMLPSTTVATTFEVNTTQFVDEWEKLVKEELNLKLYFEALKFEYKSLFEKEYVEPESFIL